MAAVAVPIVVVAEDNKEIFPSIYDDNIEIFAPMDESESNSLEEVAAVVAVLDDNKEISFALRDESEPIDHGDEDDDKKHKEEDHKEEEEGKGKSDCVCGDSVHDTLMAIGESIHKVLGELWNGCPERSRGTTRSRWLQLGTRTRRFGTRRCRRLDGLRSRWRWMRRPPRKNGLEKLFENIVGDGAAAKDQRKGNGKQRRDE